MVERLTEEDLGEDQQHEVRRQERMFQHDRDAQSWDLTKRDRYAKDFFVTVSPFGSFGLPTLHHYYFPGLLLPEIEYLRYRQNFVRSGASVAAMERQFQTTKLLLRDLYFFYHRGVPRKLGLQYRAQYVAQTASMFDFKTEEKLHDLKCRFFDLSALEQCATPTVQIEMGWKMLDWLQREVLEKQKAWFKRPPVLTNDKDENGVVVSLYYIEPKQDDKYEYVANGKKRQEKRRISGNDSGCDSDDSYDFQLLDSEWNINCRSTVPHQQSRDALKLIYQYALMFEVEQLNKDSDLEMAAILSGTSLSFQKQLYPVFAGLKHLPFSATKSLRSMLDYFSSSGNFENQWQAQQLKMGLWFCNPYGRTAWYILMSSVLYTWELLAKFRRPIASQCNIYYRDTTSMARGPDQVAVVNDVAFRDCAWFTEEGAEQATGDPDFWFGVLSHINRDYCIKVVERFREFATDSHEFTQFTPVPMYTVTTKNRNVDVKPGVKDLNCQNWRLESAQNRWKPIKLGAVFDKGCNRFSLFYRYYVFCTTTGCDYLFYYGSTGPSQHRSLYPHIPQIEQRKLLSRKDTLGVLEAYFKTVHQRMNLGQRIPAETSPRDDLRVMQKYWRWYHDAQDSLTLCLEIQQRLLYESCREQLLKRIERVKNRLRIFMLNDPDLQKLEQTLLVDLPTMVLQGIRADLDSPEAYSKVESTERIEFVDILARLYLFNTCLLELLPQASLSKFDEWPKIDEYNAADISPVPLDDQEHLDPDRLEELLDWRMPSLSKQLVAIPRTNLARPARSPRYQQLPQPKRTPAELPFELRPFVAIAVTQRSELIQPHLKMAPLAVPVKQEMEEEKDTDKDVDKTAAQWQKEQEQQDLTNIQALMRLENLDEEQINRVQRLLKKENPKIVEWINLEARTSYFAPKETDFNVQSYNSIISGIQNDRRSDVSKLKAEAKAEKQASQHLQTLAESLEMQLPLAEKYLLDLLNNTNGAELTSLKYQANGKSGFRGFFKRLEQQRQTFRGKLFLYVCMERKSQKFLPGITEESHDKDVVAAWIKVIDQLQLLLGLQPIEYNRYLNRNIERTQSSQSEAQDFTLANEQTYAGGPDATNEVTVEDLTQALADEQMVKQAAEQNLSMQMQQQQEQQKEELLKSVQQNPSQVPMQTNLNADIQYPVPSQLDLEASPVDQQQKL